VLTSPTALFMLLTALGVAGALASVRADMPRAYALSKTIASLAFIGTALVAGAMDAVWSRVALGALVFSAVGDVALTVRGKKGFLVGLMFFAVAHTVYAVAFILLGTDGIVLAMTASAMVLVAGRSWISLNHHVPEPMRVPVGVYVVIITMMMATGTAAGITHRAWLLALGVLLVAGSDIAVARQRFGKPMLANKFIGLPAYYAGQTLIALSLAGPCA